MRVCDICEKNDKDFDLESPVTNFEVEINHDKYQGQSALAQQDLCVNCSKRVYKALNKVLHDFSLRGFLS